MAHDNPVFAITISRFYKVLIRLCCALFLISVTTISAHAQSNANTADLGTLTLKRCIAIAQKNSPLAQSARSAFIASKWQYRSFQADLLPSFSLAGDAPNFNKSLFQNTLDNGRLIFSSQRQSNATTSLSITQNIMPTGGTLKLSSGVTRLGIFRDENTYLWQSTPLVVSYQQPIFQFNNLKWQDKLQPLQYRIAKKQFIQQMEGIAVTVTRRFFDVFMDKINLENDRFNVTRNDSIYRISKGRYNVGTIAENDLLQTELALRNAEASLSSARLQYQSDLNNFKILLGYPTSVTLDITPPVKLPNLNINVGTAQKLAIQNNSEALGYRLQELQADRNYAQAKSNATFSATLDVNFGLNQISNQFSQLYDNPGNKEFLTLDFNVPIFNWGKERAQIKAARNQQEQVENNIEYHRRQFYQNVEATVKQFMQLPKQVQLAAKADTIAQLRYNVAQDRYMIGKIDITNLFIAQNEKDQARRGYISALREFWTGWYELRQMTLYDFQTGKPISYDR